MSSRPVVTLGRVMQCLQGPTTAPARVTLTVQEAADALGVSYITVHRLIHAGRLRTVPGLRVNLIPVSALQEFADS